MAPMVVAHARLGAAVIVGLLGLAPPVVTRSAVPPGKATDGFGHAVEPDITISEPSAFRPGESVPVILHVRSRAGLRLLAPEQDDAHLISASVALESTQDLAIVRAEWPAAPMARAQAARLLPAEFDVRLVVQLRADARPGPGSATIRLRFQQCDDRGCYIPSSSLLRVPFTIATAG